METDRVVLLTHEGEPDDDPTDRAAQLAKNITGKLDRTFELIDIGVEIEAVNLEEMYEYETLYPKAHDYILEEIKRGERSLRQYLLHAADGVVRVCDSC